jgi:hypothetical protein
MHVLVAAAGEIDDDRLVLAHCRRDLHGVGHGVCGFQRRDDALGLGAELEGGQRLIVPDRNIFDAAGVAQPGMLGADAGIVEAGEIEWPSRICPSSFCSR